MRVLVLAVPVLALALDVPADAGPRKGRIVRVERPRTGARGLPRICRLNDATSGICWGKPPVKDELGWVVGPESRGNPGNRGQIRIGDVTEAQDTCSTPVYWNFQVEPMDANLQDLESWQTWVLLDVDVAPSARAIEPSDVTSGPDDRNSPWLAVDRGRGNTDETNADFVVTAFQCEELGASPSGGSNGYCLDYWIRNTGVWTRHRRDVVTPSCP